MRGRGHSGRSRLGAARLQMFGFPSLNGERQHDPIDCAAQSYLGGGDDKATAVPGVLRRS